MEKINLLENVDLAIILGSGVDYQPANIDYSQTIAYSEIASLPLPMVEGHTGVLTIYVTQKGLKIATFKGRFHLYEGHDISNVQAILRLLHEHNVANVLITNAAGGISDQLSVGDLCLIKGVYNFQMADSRHLDLYSQPPMPINTALYRQLMVLNPEMKRGNYVAVWGPNFETDAEVQLFRAIGGDMVGMSTYLELKYALEKQISVAGISVITNSWADNVHTETPPSHAEVLENSQLALIKFKEMVDKLVDSSFL